MEQVKIWVLLGAVGVMGTIIAFIVSLFANQAIKKLDDIVHELRELMRTTAVHNQQISHMEGRIDQMHQRLNDHAERVRMLEISSHNSNHVET